MIFMINDLNNLPTGPGVYLMKSSKGKVIYVGKAANLKKRVSSYFKRPLPDPKTAVMVRHIVSFDTILTLTEKEALIFEANLIKKHQPHYNVILKNGKGYPLIRLDRTHAFPNLGVVRKINKDGSLYFGPYSSAHSMHQTLKFIKKNFKLRKCINKNFQARIRPCIQYQMKACLGPCCLDVNGDTYAKIIKEVSMFLKGRTPQLIKHLKSEMQTAADQLSYELAAELRDRINALEKTLEQQVSVSSDLKNRDVIGMVHGADTALLTLMFVRSGCLTGTRNFNLPAPLAGPKEIIRAFIRQYYQQAELIPAEIIVPTPLEDSLLIQESLQEIKGSKVKIHVPARGPKKQLLQMAIQNADQAFQDFLTNVRADHELLRRLQKILRLPKFPQRIECFDNSNIAGTHPVAGMVVFQDGRRDKSAYRTYKIKTVPQQDDYAYMAEVLKRRFNRPSLPFPDLLMVDGGKGQLNVALRILQELNLIDKLNVIGIAKAEMRCRHDKIYKPGVANSINFSQDLDLLLFLQRIRDESHRFAISFHRQQRSKTLVHSALDSIPGIGIQRKKNLLQYFGSIKKIQEAELKTIAGLPGFNQKLACAVSTALDNNLIQ